MMASPSWQNSLPLPAEGSGSEEPAPVETPAAEVPVEVPVEVPSESAVAPAVAPEAVGTPPLESTPAVEEKEAKAPALETPVAEPVPEPIAPVPELVPEVKPVEEKEAAQVTATGPSQEASPPAVALNSGKLSSSNCLITFGMILVALTVRCL